MSRRACTRAAARMLVHSLQQQRSGSIPPPFVAEFPPERSDPHRPQHHEHHLPRPPTRQEGRPRRHTSYPTGLVCSQSTRTGRAMRRPARRSSASCSVFGPVNDRAQGALQALPRPRSHLPLRREQIKLWQIPLMRPYPTGNRRAAFVMGPFYDQSCAFALFTNVASRRRRL